MYIGVKHYYEFKDELDVHKDLPQKTLHFIECFVLQGVLSTAILILTLLTLETEVLNGPALIITVFYVVPLLRVFPCIYILRVHKDTFQDDEEYSRTTNLTNGSLSSEHLIVKDDVEAVREKARIKEWNERQLRQASLYSRPSNSPQSSSNLHTFSASSPTSADQSLRLSLNSSEDNAGKD